MDETSWRLLPFEENNAYNNMAADEAIYRCFPEHRMRTIRFYGWNPSSVSIGQHQSFSEEIDHSMVEKYKFDSIRRITGGGAVFHDRKGELTYSVVTSTDYLESVSADDIYYEIAKLIFEPLISLGVPISNGKKISGNAQARSGNVILQHGTILIDYDPQLMYSVLKARPGKTRSDMVASVYQKVTTISQQIKKKVTREGLAEYIIDYYSSQDKDFFKTSSLFGDEVELMKDLVSSKYMTKEWLYLR
ncbi:MAG: lipoate--protein ligase family protein [Candidatus Hodarchaeales archaeon]|jgi:lipoate-protein ligase A